MVLYKLSLSFCSKVLLAVSREIPQHLWNINSAATLATPCWQGISHLKNSLAQKRDGWSHLSILLGLCNSKVLKTTIVFDGYPAGRSIKDITHLRRPMGCWGPEVHFSGQIVISLKFLSNLVKSRDSSNSEW
jgi:hypothetical protein